MQTFLSEVKLGSNTAQNPFVEIKSTCTKRPGPQPKNPLSIYTLIVMEDDPMKITMIFDFVNLEGFSDSKLYYTIGSPEVNNVDVSFESQLVQMSFYRHNGILQEPVDKSLGILILENVSKSEAKKMKLLKNAQGLYEPKLVPTDVAKMIEEKVVDMIIISVENEEGGQDFDRFWKKDNSQQNMKRLYASQTDSSTDLSFNMCGDYVGFNPSFLVKIESPGEKNNCVDENFKEELTHPLLHFVNDVQLQKSKETFDSNWLEACQHVFPKTDSPLMSLEVQKWLRFNSEAECKFTCTACLLYFQVGFRPDYKHKSYIVKQGYLSGNIYDNRDAVRKHEKNEVHLEALEFYNRLSKAELQDLQPLIADFEKKEQLTFNATMNVVLFVYAELKAGVSFRSHETFMKAMRLTGSNVCWFHHTGPAAQTITKIISRSLHHDLLHSLVKENQPFSILVDSTTSKNHPYLAVYFQTTRNYEPVTHFYALVYMAKGEKSRDMVDALIQQIKLDSEYIAGFEIFFKSKVSSISSDGASVMVGSKTSFRVFLIEYIGRPIPNIVCLAHNLDRAYKIGIKVDKSLTKNLKPKEAADSATLSQLSAFENFDKIVKKLYKFYAGRGHKNWLHFLESANYLDKIPKTMKYPYDIRWSETLFESVLAVHHNWFPMVFDLDEIVTDKDFEALVKTKAAELHQRLTDKSFLLILHEFLDILTTFKTASKLFQKSSSIVVGKVEIVYEVLDSLNELKAKPGKYLGEFLDKVSCAGECQEGQCMLEQFDSCAQASISGINLEHQYPVGITYSEVRNAAYESLIASVGHYFKLEMLESFEVFNPSRLAFQVPSECAMQEESSTSSSYPATSQSISTTSSVVDSSTPADRTSTSTPNSYASIPLKVKQMLSGTSIPGLSVTSVTAPTKPASRLPTNIKPVMIESKSGVSMLNGKVGAKELKDKEREDEEFGDEEFGDEELEDVELKEEDLKGEKRYEENLYKETPDIEILDKETPDIEILDKETRDKQILDKETPDIEILDKETPDIEILDKETPDKEMRDKETPDKEMLDKETPDKEILDEETPDKEILDKETPDYEKRDKKYHRRENLGKEKQDHEKLDKDIFDKDEISARKFGSSFPIAHKHETRTTKGKQYLSRKPRSALLDPEDAHEDVIMPEDESQESEESHESEESQESKESKESKESQESEESESNTSASGKSRSSSTSSSKSGSSSAASSKSGSSSSSSSKSGPSSSTSSESESNTSDTSSSETSKSDCSSSDTDETDSSSSETDESNSSPSKHTDVLEHTITYGPIGIDYILARRYKPIDAHVKHHVNENYGFRMDYLCRFYYIHDSMWCTDFLTEWIGVLDCLLATPELRDLNHLDAPQFWPHALHYCASSWTTATKKMVQLVLVTSYSSSECERGFSIMNNIKTKSRSSLEKETIDAIMKAKINGPELEDLFTYKLTTEVLKTLARADDNEFRKKKN